MQHLLLDQADLALPVVNASEGGFETGMGCEGSTQEHVQLAYCMGLREAVDRMDRLVWAVWGLL